MDGNGCTSGKLPLGPPSHVDIATGIDHNAQALISLAAPRAAQVSRVDQGECGALNIKPQLADEDVSLSAEETVSGERVRKWKVGELVVPVT